MRAYVQFLISARAHLSNASHICESTKWFAPGVPTADAVNDLQEMLHELDEMICEGNRLLLEHCGEEMVIPFLSGDR